MRPSYGFFYEHPRADAFAAHHPATHTYKHARIVVGVLPDLAKRFLAAQVSPLVPLQLRYEPPYTVVLCAADHNARTRLRAQERQDASGGRFIESWQASFTEVSAPEVAAALKHFGRHEVGAALVGKDLRLTLPQGFVHREHREPAKLDGRTPDQRLEAVPAQLLPALVEPPRNRTLLLEGDAGEIVAYNLPRRIALAVTELVAPYRAE